MRNTCIPFNNKTLSNFIDMGITFENNKYVVVGLTESFCPVELGHFDDVLEAYGCCCSYGFEVRSYTMYYSNFRAKVVEFTLD